jgi:hypothetical protein
VVNHTYDIGGWAFGIRTNSEAVGTWLDECLREYRIDDPDHEIDPYYSLLVETGDSGSSVRRYHLLYRETMKIGRTFDLVGLGRTLLSELESYLFAEREDALYADAVVVAKDGATGLVPEMAVQYIDTLGRRVERAGVILPVDTKAAIDLTSGDVVPIEPMLRVPGDALDRLARIGGTNGRDHRLPLEGPVKVDTVFSIGSAEEPLQSVPPGLALYRMATHAVNMRKLGRKGLEALSRTVEGARCYEVASKTPVNVLDALAEAIRRG